MIQRDEWEQAVTKLKKVQKENEFLRNQVEMIERESDYWEHQAKTLEIRKATLEAQLALWKGTAP
tara:strand:- start:166 stop:360 length:195 start_codon:yes stop_codon:yes gene_type:complete